jgi:hypothetical protein
MKKDERRPAKNAAATNSAVEKVSSTGVEELHDRLEAALAELDAAHDVVGELLRGALDLSADGESRG